MGEGTQARGIRFAPATTVRAYQAIVQQIEEAIGSRVLLPGDRLPGERQLMAQFGVGRSSVREALRVLEASGLVRSRPGDPRGPEVLAPQPDQLAGPLGRLARTDEVGLAQLIEYLMMVESWMYLTAAMADPGQLVHMEQALQVFETSVEGGRDFETSLRALHSAVAAATGNQLIQWCAEAARVAAAEVVTARLVRAEDRTAVTATSLTYRRRAHEAILAGDGPQAARLVRLSLFDYYVGEVPESERPRLRYLADQPGPGAVDS